MDDKKVIKIPELSRILDIKGDTIAHRVRKFGILPCNQRGKSNLYFYDDLISIINFYNEKKEKQETKKKKIDSKSAGFFSPAIREIFMTSKKIARKRRHKETKKHLMFRITEKSFNWWRKLGPGYSCMIASLLEIFPYHLEWVVKKKYNKENTYHYGDEKLRFFSVSMSYAAFEWWHNLGDRYSTIMRMIIHEAISQPTWVRNALKNYYTAKKYDTKTITQKLADYENEVSAFIIGKTFGKLTVTEKISRSKYLCQCECGNSMKVHSYQLKNGSVKSCGNHEKIKDLTGKKIGRLTAVRILDERTKKGGAVWEWECNCGKKIVASSNEVLHSNKKSCGCMQRDYYANMPRKFAGVHNIHGTCIERIKSNKLSKNNRSGITGVTWDKSKKLWLARIMFRRKYYFLGRYSNKELAEKARKQAEKMLHEPFLEWYEQTKRDEYAERS
jgi:uncharacterized protein (DUF4415 family)